MKDITRWHTWFAWYPVAFGPYIYWLRKVQRRKYQSFNGESWWIYRRNFLK